MQAWVLLWHQEETTLASDLLNSKSARGNFG